MPDHRKYRRGAHDTYGIPPTLGVSHQGYWRCECGMLLAGEDDPDKHVEQTDHEAFEYTREGKATGLRLWPSDGGGTYDNGGELRQAGVLADGRDYNLHPLLKDVQRADPDDRPAIVGQQSGPLVTVDTAEEVARLKATLVQAMEDRNKIIAERDSLQSRLRAVRRSREHTAEELRAANEKIAGVEQENEALRATVVEQAAVLKDFRGRSVPHDMVDVDALPDHLRTAVHKLREHIGYRPLALKGSSEESLGGDALSWILADVVGGGPRDRYGIWSYTGDVYQTPYGEVDDNEGIIIRGTRRDV